MSTRSNAFRLAFIGLLVARSPRWLRKPVAFMALGALLAVALLALAMSARANEVCTVADPSGTPLNVRSQPKPNGSILGALNNDTSVVVKERRGQWASIVPESAGKSGWVWAEYLSCGKNLATGAAHAQEIDIHHGDNPVMLLLEKADGQKYVGEFSVQEQCADVLAMVESRSKAGKETWLTLVQGREPERLLNVICVGPPPANQPRIYDCKGETVEVTFFDHHGGEMTVYHISMDIENGRAARYVRNTLVVKPGPRRPLTIRFEPDPPQKKGVPDARDPSKLVVLPRLTVNGHRCRQTSHHGGDGE
jgi:uncharacterized protein YraI